VISLSDIFSGLELRHQMQVKLFNQFQQSRLRRTHPHSADVHGPPGHLPGFDAASDAVARLQHSNFLSSVHQGSRRR
jgi:hypothetical protein